MMKRWSLLASGCFFLSLSCCTEPEKAQDLDKAILGTWKYERIEYRNPDEKLNQSFGGECWKDNIIIFRENAIALFHPGENLCGNQFLDTMITLKYAISRKDSSLEFDGKTRYRILELSDSLLSAAEPAPQNGRRVYTFRRIENVTAQ